MKTSDGLSIKRVNKNDRGEYKCQAIHMSNVTASMQEKVIRLNIQRKRHEN